MLINHRVWCSVFAGMFVAATLGLGLSVKTGAPVLGRPGEAVTHRGSAASTFDDFWSAYDIAAGDDFLVSATPGHRANGQTGKPEVSCRRVEIHRSVENMTPAEMTEDEAAFAAEGGGPVTSPVDFTLAPGSYPLAAISAHAFDTDGQTDFLRFAASGGDIDAFAASSDAAFGLAATQDVSAATNLAHRLYAESAVPESSIDALLQRQALEK